MVGFVGPMTDANRPAIITRPDQTALIARAMVGVGLARRLWRSGIGRRRSDAGAKLEVEIDKEGGAERLLACWLIEFAPPRSPWIGLMPIHHRSAAFGTFGDVGGSNALVFGMRRRF